MCGIAGYVGLAREGGRAWGGMSEAQLPRWPVGSGTFIDGRMWLAHEPLRITGLNGGHQLTAASDVRLSRPSDREVCDDWTRRAAPDSFVAGSHDRE